MYTSETSHSRQGAVRTHWFQLGVICAASFVVWSGFGAILPYLPVFLQEQAHASVWLIGVVAAFYYVGTFLFSAPLGRLSDSIGRKPIIVSGVFLYAVATCSSSRPPTRPGSWVSVCWRGWGRQQ